MRTAQRRLDLDRGAGGFCEDIYRREYRYEDEVLVTGYPRDDVLSVDPRQRRSRGVLASGSASQPTRRSCSTRRPGGTPDATGAWSAKLFDELDLDRLAAALGDDSHDPAAWSQLQPPRRRARALSDGGIIDVTRYPEINDLILAADVAVLDYSSLRFDWLITGKPLLFFVPDLDEYLSAAHGAVRLRTDRSRSDAADDGRGHRLAAAPGSGVSLIRGGRSECNATFNGLNDGRATARVIEAFFDEATGDVDVDVDVDVATVSRPLGSPDARSVTEPPSGSWRR